MDTVNQAEKVSLIDNSVVAQILICAIVDHLSEKVFDDDIVSHGPSIDVLLTVNGHVIPFVKVLEQIWKDLSDNIDARAKEIFLEKIKGTALQDLLHTIESAEWEIEDAWNKLSQK